MKSLNIASMLLILLSSCVYRKSENQDIVNQIPLLSVSITDTSFDAPDSVVAGFVNIQLSNNASSMHSAHLIMLDSGYTTEQLIKAYADSMKTGGVRPQWMTHRGGLISETGTSEIQLLLQPGNYTWVCVLGDETAPHFAGHEHKSFKVYGKKDKSQQLGPSSLTINMTDESFELDKPISKGEQSIEIVNTGSKYHLVAISRLLPGANAEDLIEWFKSYGGPPPAKGIIATSAIGPELTARININLDTGNYVLYCMANAEGKFHLLDGAITSFVVE